MNTPTPLQLLAYVHLAEHRINERIDHRIPRPIPVIEPVIVDAGNGLSRLPYGTRYVVLSGRCVPVEALTGSLDASGKTWRMNTMPRVGEYETVHVKHNCNETDD